VFWLVSTLTIEPVRSGPVCISFPQDLLGFGPRAKSVCKYSYTARSNHPARFYLQDLFVSKINFFRVGGQNSYLLGAVVEL